MWLDRFLAPLDAADPASEAPRLRAFGRILALVIAAEYWTKALDRGLELAASELLALAAVSLLSAAAVHGRARRAAFAGLALLQAWYVWDNFPGTGNHRYLELFLALLFALLDDRLSAERRLLLRSLRWSVVVVLFYAGLQKLVHGHYLGGEFLAYSLWREPFRVVLGPLLSAAELERLTTTQLSVGGGPFRVDSLLFQAVSNAVWIAEILVAGLLLFRRTRPVGWIVGLALVVATELVARELLFGIEIAGAILLFAPVAVLRRAVAPAAILLGLLVLIRLGVLPQVYFS